MKPKRPAGPRLGELLETRGRLQRDVLLDVLRHQRASGGRIGTCLVELEKISEDDLLHVLSDQLKVPFTPPEDLRALPEEVVKLIPEKVARQRFSIPLRSSSTHLTVAMRDPSDLLALDEIAFVTGKRIRPQVASEMRVLEALAKYYGVELAPRFVKLLDRLNRERYFWARDEAAAPKAQAVVDLPAIVMPPKAPDLHLPAAPPAVARTGAPLSARHPSGEILAPIVSVFAPAAPGQPVVAPPPAAASPPPVAVVPPQVAAPAITTPPGTPPTVAPLPVAPPVVATPPSAPPPPVASPASTPAVPAPPAAPAAATPAVVVPAPASPTAPSESAPAAAARLSIEEAEARLRDPGGRDEIGQLLLDFVRGRAANALLLMVRRDEAAGWLGFGPGLDDESVEACRVELNSPSFVRELRDGSSMHRGALSELPAHAEIRAMLGTNWATDLLALPLRMRERLVSVLVMTLEEGLFSPELIEEMTRLAGKASAALELLVLKQKSSG